jgi:hypothetical protein
MQLERIVYNVNLYSTNIMILRVLQSVIPALNLENLVHNVIYKMDVLNVVKDIGHSLEYVLKVCSDIFIYLFYL